MVQMILTYLLMDAVISLLTLFAVAYVFQKRGWHIRALIRNWLGIVDPTPAQYRDPYGFDENHSSQYDDEDL